jgi:hypothetical protein
MNRQTICFDGDGVILDFSGPFSRFWNEGLASGRWEGITIDANPKQWRFRENQPFPEEVDRAMTLFFEEHDPLPLLDPNICSILRELGQQYSLELVSAYPSPIKRQENLSMWGISFDVLSCGISDKLEYIRQREAEGIEIVAFFEDGPHYIVDMIEHFKEPHVVWSPRQWNYLSHLYDHSHIRFYQEASEWMTLLK